MLSRSEPSKRLARLACAISLSALAACATVGPNFQRPIAPKTSGYAQSGDAAPAGVQLSPEARAAGPWWQAFGSPELDEVVRQALRDSPTIAEATATLARARENAAAVGGAMGPQVDANASAVRERINTAAFGFAGFPSPTLNLLSVGASVSYDLDLFGGRRRAREEAQAQAEAEAQRAEAAYLALSGNVALQAMRIASLRAEIAAVETVIGEDQRLLELVRAASRAGGEAPAAIAGGQSQLGEDQALLPPLQRQLAAARHQMALLAGKSPAEWSPPDFDFARLSTPGVIPVSLPSELVRQRPDILAAEADLHAATAAIGVATANLYPNVRLSASLTQTTPEVEDLFRYQASGWSIGPSLTAPIFHGGALRSQKRASEAAARVALARYQRTVLGAFTQVSDVLAALAADQQAIEAYTRTVRAAETNARNAQTAYRLGGGSLLQVVDAQRSLSRASRGLIQAQGLRYADMVQLFTATAADWRVTAAPTGPAAGAS